MPWTARTAIIVSFVLLGCEQPAPPPAEATLVRALGVQMTQFDRTAALTGEIRARHESNLGFRVGGKVIERLVDVGATVAEGDLLARLDSQDQQNALKAAQSDVAAAQAAIEQSRTQEERQRKLLADGYTTRTQYDNAQRRYAQAQAELAGAQAKLRSAQDTLSYTELRADRAGVITAKGAEPGQVVASGQMVVRLADPNEREAVFQVPGAGLRLEGGSAELPPVEVRLVSDQNLVTEGTIREVSPGVDPVTRTYTVKVALIDPPPAFLLGSSVVGRAKLPTQSVINLPSSALFQTAQGEPAVWVVDQPQDTVSLRPVSVLQYDTGTVTVSSGLECRRNGRDRRQPEAQAGTEGHDQAGERSMMCWQIPKPGARLLPAAFLIMAMAGAMTLAGCEERNAHEADAAPVIRPVRTITVQPVIFSLSGSVTGTIEARAEADLGFRIAGKLIERKVDVGDGVRAGDVLARLDDQDQRNALRTAEADLAAAQAEQVQASNEEARKRELLSKGEHYSGALRCRPDVQAHGGCQGGGRPGGPADGPGPGRLHRTGGGQERSGDFGRSRRGSGRRGRRDGGAGRPAGGARGRVQCRRSRCPVGAEGPGDRSSIEPARRTLRRWAAFGRSRPRPIPSPGPIPCG